MSQPEIRRYYFDAYALTYDGKGGWALLHKADGIVGTNLLQKGLADTPYEDGRSLLAFVEDAMARGLGDPI